MANDPSLENLNPDVALDSNSLSDSSNLDIDSQLGNVPLPDDEPSPSDDFPVEDQPDDFVDDSGSPDPGSQNPPPQPPPAAPPSGLTAEQIQSLANSYLEQRKQAANARAQAEAFRQRQLELARQQELARTNQFPPQQPPQPQPQQNQQVPLSQQDPVRYQYYLRLCKFMPPQQALELVNQQDQYYEARFQKQFENAMKQYTPFFERSARDAYVTDLGNLAQAHIMNFHSAAAPFGVTPEESRDVVMTHLKAYIDSGHRDLVDIHNWFSSNSARILAATIQEKNKMIEEEKRSNAKNQYLAGKNAPSTIAPSTKAAANMVSTGQEALMKNNGAITGGAPSGTAPSAANGVIQSLMAQTGLNAFSAS